MNYETFTIGCPLYTRCANGNNSNSSSNNKHSKATHDPANEWSNRTMAIDREREKGNKNKC